MPYEFEGMWKTFFSRFIIKFRDKNIKGQEKTGVKKNNKKEKTKLLLKQKTKK